MFPSYLEVGVENVYYKGSSEKFLAWLWREILVIL